MARLAQGEGEKMKFFLSQKVRFLKGAGDNRADRDDRRGGGRAIVTIGAVVTPALRENAFLGGRVAGQRQPFALASQFEATTLVKSH
jgi:hypothetical protein